MFAKSREQKSSKQFYCTVGVLFSYPLGIVELLEGLMDYLLVTVFSRTT